MTLEKHLGLMPQKQRLGSKADLPAAKVESLSTSLTLKKQEKSPAHYKSQAEMPLYVPKR